MSQLNSQNYQEKQLVSNNLVQNQKKNKTDDIYQAMSEAIKQTLGEFEIFDENQEYQENIKKERKYQMQSIMNQFQQVSSNLHSNKMELLQNKSNKIFLKGENMKGQPSSLNGKNLKRKLVKVLQSKIEKIKEKQLKKRQLKLKNKQQKLFQTSDDTNKNLENTKQEVLIRLKPLTQVSKDYITKDKGQNSLLQFRLMIGNQQAQKFNRTIKDIINLVCSKWDLKKSQVELRLCKSAADIVQQDPKSFTKFDKNSDNKISDLLNDIKQDQGKCNNTLYLLYEIKKLNITENDSDESDMSDSYQSSSSDKDDNEESKQDQEDDDFVDIFTDILSLIVLNRKQKTDIQNIDFDQAGRIKDIIKASNIVSQKNQRLPLAQDQILNDQEMPQFAQGLEFYSQRKFNNINNYREIQSQEQFNEKLSFAKQFRQAQNFAIQSHQGLDSLKNQSICQFLIKFLKFYFDYREQTLSFQNKINSPTNSRKSAFKPINRDSSQPSTLNDIQKPNTINGKITSFKQYFDIKKQSSATPSQNENNQRKDIKTEQKLQNQDQYLQPEIKRQNSQNSVSAVDYNNHSDSMKCKEHITTSNFINFGTQKIRDPDQEKTQHAIGQNGFFGFGDHKNIMYFEDEHSLMKSCGFCQNSMNNLLWPPNGSNILPALMNNNFNKVNQHHINNQMNLSPYQIGTVYDNSNIGPFNSQLFPIKGIQNFQEESNRLNPYQARTPFIDESQQVLQNDRITPKKLTFKQEQQVKQQEKEQEKVKEKEIIEDVLQQNAQNQIEAQDFKYNLINNQQKETKENNDKEMIECITIPHPDKIFALAASNKKQQQQQQKQKTKQQKKSPEQQEEKSQKQVQKQKQVQPQPPYASQYSQIYPPVQYGWPQQFYPYQQTLIKKQIYYNNLKLQSQNSGNSNFKVQQQSESKPQKKSKNNKDQQYINSVSQVTNNINLYYQYFPQYANNGSMVYNLNKQFLYYLRFKQLMVPQANPYFYNLIAQNDDKKTKDKKKSGAKN